MRNKKTMRMMGMKKWERILALCLAMLMTLLICTGCGRTADADKTTWGRADAKEIDVNSKIAGRVVALYVKEGDTVKEGRSSRASTSAASRPRRPRLRPASAPCAPSRHRRP